MTEANLLDNRLPEIWAYLAFINAELGRLDEASLCYKQAMKVIKNYSKTILI